MCTSVPQERWCSAHGDYILLLFFFLISNKLFILESLKKIRLKGFLRHSAEHSKCCGREWEQRACTAFGNEGQSRRSPHLHPLLWCRRKCRAQNFIQMPLWDCSGLKDPWQGYHACVSIWRGSDQGTAQLPVRDLWQVVKLKEPSEWSSPDWGKSVLRLRELELAPWQPFLLPGGKSSAIWAREHLLEESWICQMLEIVQLKLHWNVCL